MSYSRDDFKLTFYKDGAQFFVNEKKRIVVCKVSAEINVPWDYESVVSIPWKKFEGEGIAKCSPEDVFDVERGKRIALAKAENQAYLNATHYLHNIYMQLEFFMDRIKNFKEKALRHCVHNEDYMNSIHDKNHPMYKDNLNKIKHGYTNGKPNWDVEAVAGDVAELLGAPVAIIDKDSGMTTRGIVVDELAKQLLNDKADADLKTLKDLAN